MNDTENYQKLNWKNPVYREKALAGKARSIDKKMRERLKQLSENRFPLGGGL